MIIEDKELLGEFTIQVLTDGMSVYEPGSNGERKHSVKKSNISEAMQYIMGRRVVSMEKVMTLKEYFEFINTYNKNLMDTSSAGEDSK